ncbi:Phosphoglycolate phosphatase [Streptomyces alboniger]
MAEALAEYWHARVRAELGFGGEDPADVEDMFALKYRGARFSLGYGACPDLEDRAKIADMLRPERIGVHLSEEFQLHPEQSTDAIVIHHPEAKYFFRRALIRGQSYTGRSSAGRLPCRLRRATGLLVPHGRCGRMTSTVPALNTRTAEGSTLQAVLLDMDGTLVDTEGFWWDAEVEVFARLGHTLDEAWRDVVVGGPMTRSAAFLIESTGADVTVEELTVLLNDGFEDRIGRSLPLMPGAARLLAELAAHDVPMALVSASHRRIIDRAVSSARSAPTTSRSPSRATRRPAPRPHPDPLSAQRPRGSAPTPPDAPVIEDTATGVAAAEAAGC